MNILASLFHFKSEVKLQLQMGKFCHSFLSFGLKIKKIKSIQLHYISLY